MAREEGKNYDTQCALDEARIKYEDALRTIDGMNKKILKYESRKGGLDRDADDLRVCCS